jgi:hypothetical protein
MFVFFHEMRMKKHNQKIIFQTQFDEEKRKQEGVLSLPLKNFAGCALSCSLIWPKARQKPGGSC